MQRPISVETRCPMCCYDLRGLTDPRCPECGLDFTWQELIDAKRDHHPWLFEHGYRPWSNPLRAFRLTVWRAGLRPWKFWRDVSPTNPVNLKRLVLYWAVLNLPLLLLTVLAVGEQMTTDAHWDRVQRAKWTPVPGHPQTGIMKATGYSYPLSAQALDSNWPSVWSEQFASNSWQSVQENQVDLLIAVAVAAAWPWLTAAAMRATFGGSLRRSKIDARHTIRSAVYSSNVAILLVVVALALLGPAPITDPFYSFERTFLPVGLAFRIPDWATSGVSQSAPMERWWASVPKPDHLSGVPVFSLGIAVFALVTTVRLTVAFGKYTRLDHPFLTAVTTQIVVAVCALIVVLRLTSIVPVPY